MGAPGGAARGRRDRRRHRLVPRAGLSQVPRIAAAEIRLLRLVRAFQPDVIHAHLLKAVLSCRFAAAGYRPALRVTQVPRTVHLRSPLLRTADRFTLFRDEW